MDIAHMVEAGSLVGEFPLPHTEPFTGTQAREAGVGRHQLTTLIRAGLLRRPIQGVYLATEVGDSLMLRARCLRLVVPEDAVIVDRHAGWLHGAQMVLRPNEHINLAPVAMYLPAGRGRLRNDLADSGERSLRPTDVTTVHGLRVTTPLRTAWDLGRVRWPDTAIAGLDAMMRLRVFDRQEFLEGVEQFRRRRWVTILRAVAPLADGRSESPGESVLRLRCHENSLHGMVPQIEVHRAGVLIARLDLADEGLMLGVEYDGVEWHSSPEQVVHDRDRRAAAADEGWLIRAFGKEDVFGRRRECDRMLHEAARQARALRGTRILG